MEGFPPDGFLVNAGVSASESEEDSDEEDDPEAAKKRDMMMSINWVLYKRRSPSCLGTAKETRKTWLNVFPDKLKTEIIS